MLTRLRLALALAALLCVSATAQASDCIYGTASGNKSQCYPTIAPIDPATGLPPAAGGGGSTGSVTAAGTNGTQAQAVQGITGGVPLAVTWSAALPINNSQIGGTAIATGTGTANAGTQRVAVASDSTFVATQGTSPWVDNVTQLGGNAVALGNGVTDTGTQRVALASDGAAVSQGAASSSTANRWLVGASTLVGTGGVTTYGRLVSAAAGTNATVAKASAGRLYKIYACNTTTTAKFIKLFNKATAPTIGTDTVVLSRVLPPSGTAGVPLCQSFDQADIGWYFSAGISYVLTGGNADNDTTALAAGDVTQVSLEY